MFGYVVAERSSLSPEDLQRYQSCYCGLCRCIGQHYGSVQRAALSYDLTFLVLLLSSLYEPEEQTSLGRCAAHPLKQHASWQTPSTEYAAAMNMVLAYYNCLDDWRDDRTFPSLVQARLFRRSAEEASAAYPEQCDAVIRCMETLARIEADDVQEPDAGAGAFGQLLGRLFVWKNDRWASLLRQMGEALGRFIYLTDAILDLPSDLKHGAYNPFRTRAAQGLQKEDLLPVLKILMGECTQAFEQLPLLQDLSLMRNILYSGVWTRFYWNDRKPNKEEHHV